MDRDTLRDDLDLILELSRDELPGEWDWEPPLGTGASVAISAAEPSETEDSDTGPRATKRSTRWMGQRTKQKTKQRTTPTTKTKTRTTEASFGRSRVPGLPVAHRQAARTDRTGARSRATTRQVPPASEEPNTSPDVAPNHRPSGVPSSRANA